MKKIKIRNYDLKVGSISTKQTLDYFSKKEETIWSFDPTFIAFIELSAP